MVSGEDKFDYCMKLGAKGCINRNEFDHWGMLPHWKDNAGYAKWMKGVRSLRRQDLGSAGRKAGTQPGVRASGETTIPTSIFVCETGGMVVVCAGTTGYNATVDLRYLWMRQKRFARLALRQHRAIQPDERTSCAACSIPCLSRAFTYEEIPVAHQLMYENKHPHGNMAVLVGATEFGQGASGQPPVAIVHPTPPKGDIHTTPHPYPMSEPCPASPRPKPSPSPTTVPRSKI